MRAPFLRGGAVGRVRRKIILPVGVGGIVEDAEQVGAARLELELGGDVAERELLLRRRVGGREDRGHRAARVARVVVEGARVDALGEPDLDEGAHEALLDR